MMLSIVGNKSEFVDEKEQLEDFHWCHIFHMTMIKSSPPDLTPKHVRAARALLAWSQKDLAKAAGVATSTVADFERGQRTPVANNAQAIRGALEGAGIRFLPTGAVIGPTVPIIIASDRPGAPVRWVSAEDLSDWANRTDGAVSLPTLLAHLIRATHGPAVQLRFPSDEGVRHPGWDGYTSTGTGSAYVPKGDAGWEIGAQRSKIPGKASDDYRKRTAEPAPLDPARAAYIFVTPRHWPKKGEWAKARQDEGLWREVRAYDADDLVHWIEQTPAVGLWLARFGGWPEQQRGGIGIELAPVRLRIIAIGIGGVGRGGFRRGLPIFLLRRQRLRMRRRHADS